MGRLVAGAVRLSNDRVNAVSALWVLIEQVFDRAWTVGSLLLMGMLTTLFTFDMWVA